MERTRSQRHWKIRRADQVVQDSFFLKLPREIRTLIYRAALFSPGSIDLWTDEYIAHPECDPSLALRLAKARAKYAERSQINHMYTPAFRRQTGLEYVRKEMAVNLLATCTQVFGEAEGIFWSENTWRFSGDYHWAGVRTFCDGIGPRALARIHTLEVFPPFDDPVADSCLLPVGEDYLRTCNSTDAKNAPKMNMSNRYWGKRLTDLEDNIDKVAELLEAAKSSVHLRLVLPKGFSMEDKSCDEMDLSLKIPEELRLRPGFERMTLVVEKGAYLHGLDLLGTILGYDINVTCLPGSFWNPKSRAIIEEEDDSDDGESAGGENLSGTFSGTAASPGTPIGDRAENAFVTTTVTWESPTTAEPFLSHLTDIATLWHEPVNLSIHARGGRVTKALHSLKRPLYGFSGCNFSYWYSLDCYLCRTNHLFSIISKQGVDFWCRGCGAIFKEDGCWHKRVRAHWLVRHKDTVATG